MNVYKFLGHLCIGMAITLSAYAADQIYINVGEAAVKKSLLAMPPLQYFGTQGGNAQHIQAGQELFRVIYNDLSVSSFFTFIKPDECFFPLGLSAGRHPALVFSVPVRCSSDA